MLSFAGWSERQAHRLRWVLLLGWLLLLLSLLRPGLLPLPGGLPEGPRLFWGSVVPASLLILVVASHELWRRICPLAFASQLFRALGLQRTVPGRNGARLLARVESGSWLARHHVALQWGLLIAGLALRLLAANSDRLVLAALLGLTLVAAVAVGWAWSGKAWCQYFCPMGPVQTVITGPRALFGSSAHLGSGSRITQSMCRTVGPDGQEKSACVACQSPCIDIDAERGYWQSLDGSSQLAWAWFSYPGLVLAFFLLLRLQSPLSPHAMGQAHWALEPGLSSRLLEAWPAADAWPPLPRLLAVPLLLLLGAALSVRLFRALEVFQLGRLRGAMGAERARELAAQRTRLLSSFAAVNLFFAFSDPSLGLAAGWSAQAVRGLVLAVSAMWIHRGWGRDSATYKRESTSASLRGQLLRRYPHIDQYLDGRSAMDLSPGEVFTLAKVLPGHDQEVRICLYRDVLADLFRSGRTDRGAAFVQLQELRSSLGLQDRDHHRALRELAQEDPLLLEMDAPQFAVRNLRIEAASEAIEELLRIAGLEDLRPAELSPSQRDRLARIRRDCGLEEGTWQELLLRFGPNSSFSRQRVGEAFEALYADFGRRRALELEADRQPMLRPLLQVQDRRLADRLVALLPLLAEFPPGDPLWQRFASLQCRMPQRVRVEVQWRDRRLPSLPEGVTPVSLDGMPSVDQVLDELCFDPDADTAYWALAVLRRRLPQRATVLEKRLLRGRPGGERLEALLAGRTPAEDDLLPLLVGVPLLADLSPASLLAVARTGSHCHWRPGELILAAGETPRSLAILLRGECHVLAGDPRQPQWQGVLRSGETLGELALFSGHQNSVSVWAGERPVDALVFDSGAFDQMLNQSTEFSRRLLRQLVLRIEDLQRQLV